MNTWRKTLLILFRNKIIQKLFFEDLVDYLVRSLEIDQITPSNQSYTLTDMLIFISKKLEENRSLLSYGRLRLCRELAEDGLMLRYDIMELEDTLPIENELGRFCLQVLGTPFQDTRIWGAGPYKMRVSSDTGEVWFLEQDYRPSMLPWERDPHFFDEHPKRKARHEELVKEEQDLAWYGELWRLLVT